MVCYVNTLAPRPLQNRDYVGRLVWKARGTGFVCISVPTSTVARPPRQDTVRATFLSAMKIIRINDTETRLEYVCRPDAGGSVPAFIVRRYMARFVSRPSGIQEYFEKMRPFATWDEKDGRAVGEALLIKTEEESKKVRAADVSWEEARMRALFMEYRGLKEAGERYEWLPGMLARVVRNKIR
jgi:hypothetical protein